MVRNDATHRVERIDLDLILPPDFPMKYKDAIIKAADSCSVKKHLANPPEIKIRTHETA
jgi:ribosomal protein S12 methylthiotransferase accessory factor